MKHRYDLYDGEQKVLEGASGREVFEFTGLSENSRLGYYIENDTKILGRYSIYQAESERPKTEEEKRAAVKEYAMKQKFTEKTLAEWRNMNKRYGSQQIT